MIKEFFYGPEVIPYIESQLLFGNSLSKYISKNMALEKATARAFLPAPSTPEQRSRFEGGIFSTTPGEYGEYRNPVQNYLISQMQSLENSIALFDDWLYKKKHIDYIKKFGLDYIIYSDEIYLFVKKENSEELVRKGLKPASSYPTIGVITQSTELSKVSSGLSISENLFFELCKEIKHLIISAYDEEAYIILSWL